MHRENVGHVPVDDLSAWLITTREPGIRGATTISCLSLFPAAVRPTYLMQAYRGADERTGDVLLTLTTQSQNRLRVGSWHSNVVLV